MNNSVESLTMQVQQMQEKLEQLQRQADSQLSAQSVDVVEEAVQEKTWHGPPSKNKEYLAAKDALVRQRTEYNRSYLKSAKRLCKEYKVKYYDYYWI